MCCFSEFLFDGGFLISDTPLFEDFLDGDLTCFFRVHGGFVASPLEDDEGLPVAGTGEVLPDGLADGGSLEYGNGLRAREDQPVACDERPELGGTFGVFSHHGREDVIELMRADEIAVAVQRLVAIFGEIDRVVPKLCTACKRMSPGQNRNALFVFDERIIDGKGWRFKKHVGVFVLIGANFIVLNDAIRGL